jgi:hypothetical protein
VDKHATRYLSVSVIGTAWLVSVKQLASLFEWTGYEGIKSSLSGPRVVEAIMSSTIQVSRTITDIALG